MLRHCSLDLGCFQLVDYYSHIVVFTTGGRGCASDYWPDPTSILSPGFWTSILDKIIAVNFSLVNPVFTNSYFGEFVSWGLHPNGCI